MELEEKCLNWLLDHSEEILKANDCLDGILNEMTEIDSSLVEFSGLMTKYMSSVTTVHSATAQLTKESKELDELVTKLEQYLASISMSPEAEAGLRENLNPTEPRFWIHLEELSKKLEFVRAQLRANATAPGGSEQQASFSETGPPPDGGVSLSDLVSEGGNRSSLSWSGSDHVPPPPPPPPPRLQSRTADAYRQRTRCPSLLEAEINLSGLESLVAERLHTFVVGQIASSFGGKAPLQAARVRFHSLTKPAFDYLSARWPKKARQVIVQRYIATLSREHLQNTSEFFTVLRNRVPLAEYSGSDLKRGLLALGFALINSDVFERGAPSILSANGAQVGSGTGTQLMSMLFGSVLPMTQFPGAVKRETIPSAESSDGQINSLFGTLSELKHRGDILEDFARPRLELSEYIRAGAKVYKEELYRLSVYGVLSSGLAELSFISSYFYSIPAAEPMSVSSASEKRLNTRSDSNSESCGATQMITTTRLNGALLSTFEKVFSHTLSEARRRLRQLLIQNNCDLVSLTVMSQLTRKYLVHCRENGADFMENLLTNLGQALDDQIQGVVDYIVNTVNHNNKPTPQSNSEMFARQGCDRNDYPSTSTVKTLVETMIVLALGGQTKRVEMIKNIVQGLHEHLDLHTSTKKLRIYGNVVYILSLVDEAGVTACPDLLLDFSQWANTYRLNLSESMAVDLVNTMRPDLLETIQAAEAQLKTDRAVSDTTRVKLAKLTNTNFLDDLRKLSTSFLPEKCANSGVAVKEVLELRKEILTKYVILHTRFREAISSCGIIKADLVSADELLSEMKTLIDSARAPVEVSQGGHKVDASNHD